MKHRNLLACLLALAGCASLTSAATLQVGPTRTYQTVYAAVTAASDGDTIEIDSGTYMDNNIQNPPFTPYSSPCLAFVAKNNLTIRGVGATRPIMDGNNNSLAGKAIWVVQGTNTAIENIEFINCHSPYLTTHNCSGIRMEGTGLTLRNCYIHDNDEGILVSANSGSDILFESCEFHHNGYGDGQTHNMYINAVRSFTMQYCWSHGANVGHEVKTRALKSYIRYNLISDDSGNSSYQIDVPQGGTTYIIGNSIYQGGSQQGIIITYKEESPTNPDLHLYVVNNTIVNTRTFGTVVFVANVSGTQALVQNNIFQGYGTATTGSVNSVGNLTTTNAYLANPVYPTFDFHLTTSSTAAINHGSAAGTGIDGTSLIPDKQYVHPRSYESRSSVGVIDIGAFEYGGGGNQAPVVNAGLDQTITWPNAVSLTGSATDDGKPVGSTLSYTWSKVSGPGTVTFANANAASTTATFSVSGVYVLQLAVSDSALTGTDTVQVTVNTPPNTAPVVEAGPNQTITLPGIAALSGSATDDGLPNPPATLTYTWTKVSGPGTVTFANPNAASTTATFSAAGSYMLQLHASDSALSSIDIVTITVNPRLIVTANAAPDFVYETWPVSLGCSATSPAADPLSYLWTQTAGRTVALTGASTSSVSFTILPVGSRTEAAMSFQVTVTDGKGGNETAPVNVTVFMLGDINHDNYVNVGDLQLLVGAWGSSRAGGPPYSAAADLNNDGYINVGDLQALVANWGRTLPL